jgi:hypothetical protein
MSNSEIWNYHEDIQKGQQGQKGAVLKNMETGQLAYFKPGTEHENNAEIRVCEIITSVIKKALQTGENQGNGVRMGYSADQNTSQMAV